MAASSTELARFSKSPQIRSWPWSTLPVKCESSVCINSVYSIRKPHLYSHDTHSAVTFTRWSVYSNITTPDPTPNPAGECAFRLRGLKRAHLYTLLNLSLTNITLFIFWTSQEVPIYLLVFEKLKLLCPGTGGVILVINCRRQIKKACRCPID